MQSMPGRFNKFTVQFMHHSTRQNINDKLKQHNNKSKDAKTKNNNQQRQPATRQSNTATKKQCQQDNKTAAIQQNKQEKEEQKEKEEKKMKKGDTSRPNKERKKAESNLRLPSYLLFLAWSISSFSIILSLSFQLLAEWFRFTVADSSSLVWTRQTWVQASQTRLIICLSLSLDWEAVLCYLAALQLMSNGLLGLGLLRRGKKPNKPVTKTKEKKTLEICLNANAF